jgi:tRNA G18 (ribose-2'-O)-methylase SpoU
MIGAITHISNLDLPGLQPYRTLQRQQNHRDQGIFVSEGEKVVRRLFESALTIVSILLTPDQLDDYRGILEGRNESINVFVSPQEVLTGIVGYNFHRGIMALAKVPAPLSLNDAVSHARRPRLLVALDNIGSAENLGVIVRNCAACSADALIVGETSADPYLRRAVRNSMGTVFRLPVVYAENLRDSLQTLRSQHECKVLAAHPRPGSVAINHADLRGDCCVVLGHEDSGISASILSACDSCITIPMAAGIDSFNVACASAVILYEVRRQRGPVERS